MPRPYGWIRGEGTMKNQRGMGDVVQVDPSIAALFASANAGGVIDPLYNDAVANTPQFTTASSGTSGMSTTMMLVLAAGVGLLIVVLAKK